MNVQTLVSVDMMVADLERVPTPESGLPVIGDRYSNILHDIPVSMISTFGVQQGDNLSPIPFTMYLND